MKFKVCLIAILLFVVLPFTVSAEVIDKPVTKLEVLNNPSRTTYDAGEQPDLTGLKVRITFIDGTEYVATAEDFTVEGYRPYEIGSQLIVIRYGTYPTQLAVKVQESQIRTVEFRLTNKTRYIGDAVGKEDFEVTVFYTSGRRERVEDYTIDRTSLTDTANPTTLVWGEYKQTLNVNASKNYCNELTIKEPGKNEFMLGEMFSHEGLVVWGKFRNGAESDITSICEIVEPNMEQEGDKSVVVKYDGRETSYRIHVKKYRFDRADVSEYQESGTVYLYFKDKETPIPVTGSVWYSDDYAAKTRNYTIKFVDETYQAQGEIPEEDMRFTGSKRIRAQVPVGINVVSDEQGVLGYVRRTELQNKGESSIIARVDIVNAVEQLSGVPQDVVIPLNSTVTFALDLRNEKAYDVETKFFRPFKVIVEVPNG